MITRTQFTAVVFYLLFVAIALAQPLRWNQGGIIQNQNVYCSAVAPTGEIYFRVPEGIYRRSSNGNTFSSINSQSANLTSMFIGPTNRLCAYQTNLVYFTNAANDSILFRAWIGSIYYTAATRDNYFYFVTAMNKIYQTRDFGLTWDSAATPRPAYEIIGLVATPQGALYIGTETNGVYCSLDQGATWDSMNTGLQASERLHCITSSQEGILYLGTHAHGLYYWDSVNQNWVQRNQNIPTFDIQDLVAGPNGDLLLTGFGIGVFLYDSLQGNWSNCGFSGLNDVKLAFLPNGNLFANPNYGGAYLSTNRGIDWSGIGLMSNVQSMIADGDSLFAANQTIFRSTDFADHWYRKMEGIQDSTFDYFPLCRMNDGALIAAPSIRIYRSINHGITWTGVNTPIADYTPIKCFGTKPASNIVLACAIGTGITSILRSANQGLSWQTNQDIPGFADAIVWVDTTSWMIGTTTGSYFSSNDGVSFTATPSNPPNDDIRSFVRTSNGIVLAGTSHGVYSTNDLGSSWTPCDTITLHDRVLSLLCLSNGNIVAGTYSSGVFLSTDNGVSWTQQNNGLTNLRVYALAQTANGNIFAGTLRGVFRCENFNALPEPTAEVAVPESHRLEPAFPNPFNATTTIRYRLSHDGMIRLNVVDVLGRTVSHLYNGNQAAGFHAIEFSGEGIASGMYFVHLQIGTERHSRKIVLLR